MTLRQASSDAAVSGKLWSLGALELAECIRTGRVTSAEVVDAHLQRIEAVNPVVNAMTVTLADAARNAARVADASASAGEPLGPLHGVPFTVKENIDLVGAATTIGLRALADARPMHDAPVVERLRAAGAIPLGHTNCPTLTLRWHTDSELWGATVNPWDASRTPGASSGGEAAAIATGMSPLGLGNDGLGSLRWPAQCCGIVALKPSLGRIPHASSLAPRDVPIGGQITSVEGPMARHVRDLRLALEVLAGPTWRDPWSVPAPLRGASPPRPIRVAVVVDPGGEGTSPQVSGGVLRAAEVLARAGYDVEEIEPPRIGEAARCLVEMLATPDVRATFAAMAPLMPADARRFSTAFFEAAGNPDPGTALAAFATRQSIARAWGEFLEERPLILAPIGTQPPFLAGTDLDDGRVAETIHQMRMAMAVNAIGLPAVAIPVGVEDGLPQVVQLIADRYREDLCLDAAEMLEDRIGTLTPIDPTGP